MKSVRFWIGRARSGLAKGLGDSSLPWPWIAALLFSAAAVVGLGFCFRIGGIVRPLTQDEYQHMIAGLTGQHVIDFIDKIGPNMQPLVDFTLFRFFWFPFAGAKEIALRFPALCYSLLTLLLGFWIAFAFLTRSGLSRLLAWAAALAISLWAITHATEAFYATAVRHYSLVALVSMGWWSCFLLFAWPVLSWRFFFLSLLFANSHFFALALVGGAYGLEMFRRLLRKDFKGVGVAAGTLLFIVFFTKTANFAAFNWLTHFTPASNSPNTDPHFFVNAIASALRTWGGLFDYLDWPYLPWIVLGAAAVGAASRAWEARERFFWLLLLVQPAFYLLVRAKSGYNFGARHHSVFYGFGFITLVLVLELVSFATARWRARSFALLAAALVLAVPSLLKLGNGNFVNPKNAVSYLRKPNFSVNYAEQREAQATGLPILWIHDACYESDNPHYYLAHNSSVLPDPQGYARSVYPHGFLVLNAMGCEHIHKDSMRSLRHFYEVHAQSLLVLKEQVGVRAECAQRLAQKPRLPAGVEAQLLAGDFTHRCVWMVKGVRSAAQVPAVAKALGYRSDPAFFGSLE